MTLPNTKDLPFIEISIFVKSKLSLFISLLFYVWSNKFKYIYI